MLSWALVYALSLSIVMLPNPRIDKKRMRFDDRPIAAFALVTAPIWATLLCLATIKSLFRKKI
jgi:hypothetical protein